MSSFAGLSHLTIRSSVCVILICDPCIFSLYITISAKLDAVTYVGNLTDVHFFSLFSEQIIRAHSFCNSLLVRQFQSKLFYCGRAAKTLHRMLPCTPVSVPAKITWSANCSFCPLKYYNMFKKMYPILKRNFDQPITVMSNFIISYTFERL